LIAPLGTGAETLLVLGHAVADDDVGDGARGIAQGAADGKRAAQGHRRQQKSGGAGQNAPMQV